MKHYTYITTNLVTGKKYIGDHSTDNLNDGYLGSGKIIKESIKKYGRKNFHKEILEFFESKEEAFNAQEKYINEYGTLVPDGYNISSKGGYGISESLLSDDTKNKIRISKIGDKNPMFGKSLSKKHKEIISNLHTGKEVSEETRKKMSEVSKGKPKSEEHRKKLRQNNLGKKQSEETKQKRSISMMGKNKYKKTEEHKNKIKKAHSGKKLSEEHKKQLSIAAKKAWIIKNKDKNNG
jgi:hypothetical protein